MRPTSEQLVLDYHAEGTAELESSQHGDVSLCEESRYRGGGAAHNCASGPNSWETLHVRTYTRVSHGHMEGVIPYLAGID